MRTFFISLFTFFFLLGTGPALAEPVLKDFSGKPHQLEQFIGQGKWLVVMFWAHDCHVCNEEAPNYLKFHNEHKDKNAIVLGVSIDGAQYDKQAREFIKRHKLTFTNLIGEPDETVALFTSLTNVEWIGTPTFLIYTPTGKLVAQQAGGVPVSMIEDFIAQQTAAGNI